MGNRNKGPLRYFVTGALLIGPAAACDRDEPETVEATNELIAPVQPEEREETANEMPEHEQQAEAVELEAQPEPEAEPNQATRASAI